MHEADAAEDYGEQTLQDPEARFIRITSEDE